MNTIDRLLTSWDDTVRATGHTNSPYTSQALLQSLNFVSRRGVLQFEQKPLRPLNERLGRLITGEPNEECFHTQLACIKQVYTSIQEPLTDEQKVRALSLEDRINALGRYVFARRAEKTLFFAPGPRLSNYQIRNLSQTTTLLKPDSLKRSLRNSNWKHCWLNASLKFLAATTLYDEMLTTQVVDEELELLRKALFRMIEALRKNWDQHIIDALHTELIQLLRTSAFRHFLNGQQDADEFIVQLNLHFPSKKRQLIEYVKLYESFSDTVWKPGRMLTTDKLQVTPNNVKQFDVEESYTSKHHLENVREYFEHDVPSGADQPLDFLGYDAVTAFPEHLELKINRGEFDLYRNTGRVNSAKINLDATGSITFIENEPVYKTIDGQEYLASVRAKNLCEFRAVAAIERSGHTSNSGHYIAHTRAKDGHITTHSDTRITQNKTEVVWKNSYYLILELTNRIKIPLE